MSIGYSYDAAYLAPGILGELDTVEAALYWGGDEKQVRKMGGLISGSSLDLANTPTDVLRPGMLLGKITSSGKLIQWDPTATNGSEQIWGILGHDLKVNLNGTGTDRFYGPIIVGGPIKTNAIFRSNATYGNPGSFTTDPYENVARLQMRGRFQLDDDLAQTPFTGWSRVKSLKDVATSNAYTVLAADNGSLFTNTGTSASQNLTLPAMTGTPARAENTLGFHIGIWMTEAQNIVLTLPAGSTLYSPGSAASSGPLTISGSIGTVIDLQGVFDKTAAKWLVTINSATNTIYGGNAGVLEAVTAKGSSRSDCQAIAASTTVAKLTCASAAYGVVLPAAVFVNQRISLVGGDKDCHVYVPSSGTLNGVAGATGQILPAGKVVDVVCTDITASTQLWVSVPLDGLAGYSTTATATTDGASTGIIAAGAGYVAVTCGTAGYKVTLPTATYEGQRLVILNGAKPLNIIGVSGTIDGVAYGTGITVGKATLVTLICTDASAAANLWVSNVTVQSRNTINTAVVATAGGTISNSNAVYEGVTIVTGANDAAAAVLLPVAAIGMEVRLISTTASKNLEVFPQVNSSINNLGANVAYNSAQDAPNLIFQATSATQWYVMSDLAG